MLTRLSQSLLRFTSRSDDYWFSEAEYYPLEWFRKFLAVTLFLFFGRAFPLLHEGLTNKGIHIPSSLIANRYPLPFPLLPESLFFPFYCLLMFSFAALFFFPRRRWPPILATGLFFYLSEADFIAVYAAHKVLFISLIVVALAPMPGPEQTTISKWPLRILQLTLVSTYLGNGLAKLFFGDWLDHPDLLESMLAGKFFGPVTAIIWPYIPKMIWTILQGATLIFEIWLPLGLILPKTRKLTMICGLAFHLGISVLMQGLWPFTLSVVNLYFAFLPLPRKS